MLPEPEDEGDRVVVQIELRLVPRAGPQHGQLRLPKAVCAAELVGEPHASPLSAGRRGQRVHHAVLLLRKALPVEPNLPDGNLLQQSGEGAKVIGVAMGDNGDVDAGSPSLAKESKELAAGRVSVTASGVDQHHAAIGKVDERGVALADVEKRRSDQTLRAFARYDAMFLAGP